MSDSVSNTRLYLGNLPPNVTKDDINKHFEDGPGTIAEIKIMNGFGFLEYEDAADARDVVPHFHGSDFNGQRLTVQFARGSRPKEYPPPGLNRPPRPRRTAFRLQISGLPAETSWQDLKDFARRSGLDVVFSEISRERDGKGFVEFETGPDLKIAVEKLDNQEFKGATVRCVADIQDEVPRSHNDSRYRSRSPPPYNSRYPPPRNGGSNGGYYDRPPPPRPYRGEDDGYHRRRTPPPRDDYYGGRGGGGGYGREPEPYPRGGGGGGGGYGRDPDPYGPPPGGRRGYDDPYGPPNGYEGRGGGRRTPPPRGYGGGYDDRRGGY